MQVKLLRALQEGEIERVGGSETLKVDVRVLAATNKDLRAEIEKDRFRADLYDRLNVIPIELPPLRDHKEDVPAMVTAFVERACADNERPTAKVSDGALALLMQYDWPGNVRELKNVVERLCILAEPAAATSAASTTPARRPAVIDEESVREALPSLAATDYTCAGSNDGGCVDLTVNASNAFVPGDAALVNLVVDGHDPAANATIRLSVGDTTGRQSQSSDILVVTPAP